MNFPYEVKQGRLRSSRPLDSSALCEVSFVRVSKVSLWHLRPSSDARPRVLSWTRGGEEVGITLEGGARRAVGTGMDGRIHR